MGGGGCKAGNVARKGIIFTSITHVLGDMGGNFMITWPGILHWVSATDRKPKVFVSV